MRRRGPPDSLETRARKSAAAKAAAAERASRKRWYITINVKPPVIDPGQRPDHYRRFAWPILFKSEQEAWDFADQVNVYQNPQAIHPDCRKIISYALSIVYLRPA